MSSPRIAKALRIQGRTLNFRDARIEDAEFILSLRNDPAKSRHISATSSELSQQVAWLERYAQNDSEAYFVMTDAADNALGTVRLYDARGRSFCWGSWILAPHAPASAAIESALMVYAYALDTLGFSSAHFTVNVDNERVCAFHERFGAERIEQDVHEISYGLSEASIRASMQRYARYLPGPLVVELKN
ncbi:MULTISPECIES: GNAT family N-acetyltransferase [unclassified Rhizobacter]|uniref:GNAT family N-acetyltransferase n=1 Tax=unclassified Rhizobacter TaxID=2640088 RepID=UPI0006F4C230|nr:MULTISPECIES: GNAT family N-acetyltransferase [unclassified Rhizobacter]KQU74863.1 hypothetical protein ASC88_25940 [Rhizobacter sp. Root29]KQW01062.1 hypothetical protein ASC98_07025 [Rhizobacter sp. Root1238]KRB03912.1 hypothetical protein ASE08_14530 [Rhizobacter sp. Root16D2]